MRCGCTGATWRAKAAAAVMGSACGTQPSGAGSIDREPTTVRVPRGARVRAKAPAPADVLRIEPRTSEDSVKPRAAQSSLELTPLGGSDGAPSLQTHVDTHVPTAQETATKQQRSRAESREQRAESRELRACGARICAVRRGRDGQEWRLDRERTPPTSRRWRRERATRVWRAGCRVGNRLRR